MDTKKTMNCERCGKELKCKVESIANCDCKSVYLNEEELRFVREHYKNCLCLACLQELKGSI